MGRGHHVPAAFSGLSVPLSSVRATDLFVGTRISARLSWYAPGLQLHCHAHGRHQVSVLLAGTLAEQGPDHQYRLNVPAVGVKPAGLLHANDYGPAGALILSIELDGDTDLEHAAGLASDWCWRAGAGERLLSRSLALLADLYGRNDDAVDAEGKVWELLSVLGGASVAPSGCGMPTWVARASERLQDEAALLGELAREEGLHPAHFSRAFARWTGWTPSLFRARAQVQRALAALAQGDSIADAALQAGFADQAHFSRTARRFCGLAPKQLRALLA